MYFKVCQEDKFTHVEETDPDVERLPDEIDNNDLDLRDAIYIALRNNSETGHPTNVKVQVEDGIVNLILIPVWPG